MQIIPATNLKELAPKLASYVHAGGRVTYVAKGDHFIVGDDWV